MISRCPSCGAPAPDEARLCRACGWDFVANKKGKPEPEKPKPSAPPPAGGLSLPPARGGSADAPATGLGMAKLPKVEPPAGAPGAADENPFALPVARNLGPKPGESLFSAPPPAVEPKLPEAKPKEPAPPPEKPKSTALPPAKPPVVEPEPEAEALPKKGPPPKEPPKKIEKLTVAPAPEPVAEEPAAEDEAEPSAALFLPSSTDEIVVEPGAKRAEPPAPQAARPAPEEEEPVEEPAPQPKAARKSSPPPTAPPKPAPAANRSTLFLAALTGGAMALLLISVGAIYMMVRSEPQSAARPMNSSPFGKRTSADVGVVPVLDEPPAPPASALPLDAPPPSPAPVAASADPAPRSIPAPAMSRPIEPPKPDAPVPSPVAAAPAPAKAAPLAPVDAPSPAAVAAAKAASDAAVKPAPVPAPAAAPEPAPPRPTAMFAPTPRGVKAAHALAAAKAQTAAALVAKKPAGPQWVFEGVVYDLLTTRGVYGVRLVFVDAEDNEVASIETTEGGHYHAAMKPGPAEGYALRIVSEDYSGKHIDELDSTSSVRKADLEQRKFLMQAGARSLPWIGTVGKPQRRDMALVPKVSEE